MGLYFYAHHWHLIAWCCLREDYRDFRLDRIRSLELAPVQFRRRDFRNLQEYLNRELPSQELNEIRLHFTAVAAQFVGEQRYYFGFVEETETDDGVEMTFLVAHMEYFCRWLLPYTNGVTLVSGDALNPVMAELFSELADTWAPAGTKLADHS